MANKIFDTTEFAKVARQAVAEGVVLLKNEAKVLPLKEGTKVAVFGRSQFNYYKSGTGSGGMVNTRYVTGVYEAIEEDGSFEINSKLRSTYENWVEDNPFDAGAGWAAEPWFQKEMPVTKELAYEAREDSEVAIVLIGRTAGEDQDNSAHKGSYLLTDDEEQMLENVTKAFDKTIVLLNVGNIIDMKWVDKYNPTAVAYIWQGGQEGGSGVIDVLKGMVSPSGKLTDTIAYDIADYPSTKNFGGSKRNIQQEDIYVGYRYFETFAKDKVMYPFGYGLSYTSFDIVSNGFTVADGQVNVSVTVTNIGDYKGKQIVQAYVTKPQGKLGKPAVELVGFAKTKELKPDEQETIDIVFTNYQMASYDDSGVTGYKSAYVLEEGTYIFYVGDSVRNLTRIGTYNIGKTKVVKQLSETLAPVVDFTRIKPEAGEYGYAISYEDVPKATGSWQDVRLALLKTPKAKP
ncbi:MAG: glycoside hydrolase family 3 C-terminal domain-containing protein, partial [Pseudobutyrivibrio sp.]|nr:glycoside hydrolase family 3 C-terminal domain-containing protein [Pseudobutyrivibrio sp.]